MRSATLWLLALVVAIPALAQMPCRDLANDETETYSKPELVFTVDYPSSMSWVMELDETKVKFRGMPPAMVGFQFSHPTEPTSPEQFERSIEGWKQVFEIEYGKATVPVYAGPSNDGPLAEFKALLPHAGTYYEMYALLESASPNCPYAEALEEAIHSLRPNTESSR